MSAAPKQQPGKTAFIVAFAAIYIIWGSTYLGIRIAVETIPPFLLGAARFIIAGAVLMLLVRGRGAPKPTARQWLDNAIIGTFLLLGGNGLVSLAEQSLDSGFTALVIGIQPVFMVLTEWAWRGGQRPTSVTFAGLLLGFVGLAWLASPWESTTTQRNRHPHLSRGHRTWASHRRHLRAGRPLLHPPLQGRRGLPRRRGQGAGRRLSRHRGHRRAGQGKGRRRDPSRLRFSRRTPTSPAPASGRHHLRRARGPNCWT
jgi:hypothetical protein